MLKLDSSFKFSLAITCIIIFLVMFAVTLGMFGIPVSASEKPNLIIFQNEENKIITQENYSKRL